VNANCRSPRPVRILLDDALSPRVADPLTDAGHDAVHVRAFDMQAASVAAVFDRAVAEDRNRRLGRN
jgi:predicted nuclease of predicted toxin-antitoxin system